MSTVAASAPRHHAEMITLWVLLAISFASAVVPLGAAGGFGLILGWIPVVFAFWHFIRWAGAQTAILSFIAVSVVSFIGEALGVATGLVFGNYYYPDGPLGPLLLGVPPLIQLQYFAMAYAALMLARAVSGSLTSALRGWRMLWVAALAAFAQTLLDLASDPWHSTVLGQWIWRDGGDYFGVPMHNFFGWFFETLAFFVILQLLLTRRTAIAHIEAPKPRGFYAQGVLLYGTFPVAILLIPVVNKLAGEESTIAVAMATVAIFAVVPLWLASLLAKRR
jgi:putative membrane protein